MSPQAPPRRVPTRLQQAGVLVLLLALLGLLPGVIALGATGSLTSSPDADAYVQAAIPTVNKGQDKRLKAQASPTIRSYIRFGVGGLPAGATVSEARLRLYATTTSAFGVSVHGGVTANGWGERTINWSNAPSFSSSPLASSGAIPTRDQWIELPVTSAVTGNGPVTFVLTTSDPGSVEFASRNDKRPFRPQLVVAYQVPDPTPSPTPSPTPTPEPTPMPTPAPTPTPTPPPGDPILIGAGDIAATPSGASGGDQATALLLDAAVAANPGRVTVFTAGDNAYDSGTLSEYTAYYDPTWGRHKAITKPAPGNHEYNTAGAAGYYAYFGAAAGDPAKGYYAYDLGAWRIYVLNSEISHGAGSVQEQWLRTDLAAHSDVACVAAITHHPRFSSGSHGSDPGMSALWQALYDFNAELLLVGHDHNYQRFAPMTATGGLDQARGIREFVVGMGGRSHYAFTTPIANTEAWNTNTYGVLKLTLHPTSYDFEFVPVAGGIYSDSGSNIACH
jgi:hypothetical protein